MPNNASLPTSKAAIVAALDAAKATTLKSAAAAIVITMAADVATGTPAAFAAARVKAAQLEVLYGQISANKVP